PPHEQGACTSCGSPHLSEIYSLKSIPVQSCILLDDEKSARDFRQAPLRLVFCEACGFIFNADFDPALVDYSSKTEESQHFSETFSTFARGLVNEIAQRYDLNGKTTLEIGCGKGDFLAELVRATNTRGLGVDPGFYPARFDGATTQEIDVIVDDFDPTRIDRVVDFIVCRHTLEHISNVGDFVASIARLKTPDHGADLFFETPDAGRVLKEGAFWDIYYEHCSYFTPDSHARLFARSGFDVTDLKLAYGDQYILQYAKSRDKPAPKAAPKDQDDLAAFREVVRRFPQKVAQVRQYWRDFTATRANAGKRIALWGGSSKAVSFLTTDNLHPYISQVVDINPFRQGKYLPGTGIKIAAPADLLRNPPDTVLVMNGVYRDEIAADLSAMGLAPELVAV
ncbi:MAG: class I SAM-dependent methyltransferase, partial [Pseudopelagicola sp.]|nr:class I SAM-dependent methyltransferase [Pseudopelagicola sp.]